MVTGRLESKGMPVPGLSVTLSAESGASRPATVDAEGAFSESQLPVGSWTLTARAEGYITLEKVFTITAGQTRELGTLTLYSVAVDVATSGTVRGLVRAEGADLNAVQGGTVELLLDADQRLVTTTALGASGLFALQAPPGVYRVRATHPYFVTALAMNVTVLSRQDTQLADDALTLALNPGRLTGTVVKEVDGSAAAVPAPDVTVSADNGSSTTTAMDGTYTLAGLPGGQRSLRFSAAGLHEASPNLTAQVTPGASVALGDVSLLLNRGEVLGLVEMGDGSPARDVTVALVGSAYTAQAASRAAEPAKGDFRIPGVPVGTWTLIASRSGYRSVSSAAFTVQANVAVSVPTLPKLTRVQGDFAINDGDATNTPGFTRTREVVLLVNNTTSIAEWRAAESDPATLALPFNVFGADGGSGIAFTLSASEGEKTVYLQLKDGAGNLGPVLTANVVLDTTAPSALTLRLGDGSGFIAQDNPLPFTLSGLDPSSAGTAASGLAFMRLSSSATLDSAGNLGGPRLAYQRDDSFTRATGGEGSVTLHAQLIDHAGNTSAPSSSTVVVDTLAPSGSLTISRGADATQDGYTNSPLVTLQVSANAEPSGGIVRVRLANALADVDTATPAPASSAVAWFLDPVNDGTKTVSFRFVDSAGNQSPIQTTSVVLDRVAPVPASPSTTLVTLSSAAITNAVGGTLAPTVTDARELSPSAAVLLEVDGAATTLAPTSSTTVSTPIAFTLPPSDGAHLVRVRFKDAAGNTTSSADFALTLDRIAPVGTLTIHGALADGTPSSTLTASQTARLELAQVGSSGVLVTTAALSTCPTAASAYLALSDPQLSAFNLGVANGTATVRGCLRDDAGNTTLLTPATILVDSAAPSGCQVQLTGRRRGGGVPPAGKTATRDVTVTLGGCSEAPRDIYVVSTDVAPVCSSSTALGWVQLGASTTVDLNEGDGLQTVRGCVRDAAGNVASLTSASITLDTTPPQGPSLTLNGGNAWVNRSQVAPGATFNAAVTASASGAVEWVRGESPSTLSAFAALPAMPTAYGFTNAAEGPRTLYVRFRDDVGNDSDLIQATITFDLSAPSGSLTLTGTLADGALSLTHSASASVRVDVNQVGAESIHVTAGALAACPAAASAYLTLTDPTLSAFPTGVGAGLATVRGCLRDAAGNTTLLSPASLTVDTTLPTGCGLVLAGTRKDGTAASTGLTASASVAASLTGCTEVPSEVVVLESDGAVTCAANASFDWRSLGALSPLALSATDGTKTLRGCVRDVARNVGSLASASMTLDTTPPTAVSVTIDDGAQWINAGGVSSGSHAASLSGAAQGATEWAVGLTPAGATGFLAFATNNPRTFPVPVTGDGTVKLWARFRDDVGNEAFASDEIDADIGLPATPTLSSLDGGVFTNTPAVLLDVPVGAVDESVQLSQAQSSSCAVSDFTSAPVREALGTHTFNLQGIDGAKLVCARTRDPAGNVSAMASFSLTLDTIPPTTPRVSTLDRLAAYDGGTTETVQLVAPVTDTNFAQYETSNVALGGTWAIASTNVSTTSFTFTTVSSPFDAEGTRNTLKVRAIDRAGNVSEEGVVNLVLDRVAPGAPTANRLWVDNGDGHSRFYWTAPVSGAADLAGYDIFYDSVGRAALPSGQSALSGTYAIEGPSPVRTSTATNFTLSGLPNNASTWVQVSAVDLAGNRGFPTSVMMRLGPNPVSANRAAALTLPGTSKILRIAGAGDLAFVLGRSGAYPCGGGRQVVIHVVDLSLMQTPVQSGVLNLSSGAPAILNTLTFPEAFACTTESDADMVLDGSNLYVASSDRVYVLDASSPTTMSVASNTVASVPMGIGHLKMLSLASAARLVASAGSSLSVLALDSLYDNNGATFPTGADIVGTVTNVNVDTGGIAITRDRLVATQRQSLGGAQIYNLANALDSAATVFDNGALQLSALTLPRTYSRLRSSGNYLYLWGPFDGFNVFDATPLWNASGGPVSKAATSFAASYGDGDVVGGQVYFPSGSGPQALEISTLSNIENLGSFGATGTYTVAVSGLYSLSAAALVPVQVFFDELATPRSPRQIASSASQCYRPMVKGGFIYCEGGVVLDAQGGVALPNLRTGAATPIEACTWQSTWFEDNEVMAGGSVLRVVDLEVQTDRNTSTVPGPANRYDVALPAGTKATGVAAWGNFLVVAEIRAAGLFLEVFKVTALRDRQPATVLSASDSVGSFQISGQTGAGLLARVSMQRGRALVALASGAVANNVYVVDLRPLLKDAAPGVPTVEAALSTPSADDVTVSGNWLYAATATGVEVVNVAQAMDEDALTVMPATPVRATLGPGFSTPYYSLQVSGTYLLSTRGNSIDVFDVSGQPTQARYLSTTRMSGVQASCSLAAGGYPSFFRNASITAAGTRAYVSNGGTGLYVYELE